jgi:hypothetical protein
MSYSDFFVRNLIEYKWWLLTPLITSLFYFFVIFFVEIYIKHYFIPIKCNYKNRKIRSISDIDKIRIGDIDKKTRDVPKSDNIAHKLFLYHMESFFNKIKIGDLIKRIIWDHILDNYYNEGLLISQIPIVILTFNSKYMYLYPISYTDWKIYKDTDYVTFRPLIIEKPFYKINNELIDKPFEYGDIQIPKDYFSLNDLSYMLYMLSRVNVLEEDVLKITHIPESSMLGRFISSEHGNRMLLKKNGLL